MLKKTQARLTKMTKTIQNLKTELKKRQKLKGAQAEVKTELKNPRIQLENSRKSLTRRTDQAEDRI